MKIKKRNIILFLLLFVFAFPSLAFASDDDDDGMRPINISFQNRYREYTLGSIYGAGSYSWRWTQVQFGSETLNLVVYDSNGEKIAEGLTGQFGANVSFPVKFKIETEDTDFSIDIKITPHPVEKEEIDYRPNLDGILSALSNGFSSVVGSLDIGFSGVIETLENEFWRTRQILTKIDVFLSDPQPFNNAVDNLKSSVDNMSNMGPMGVAKKLSDIEFEVGNVDNLPSLEIEFFKGHGKINVFDLSQMHSQIIIIRNLLRAILYLGVVFFIMQSVVPQFKV